MIIRGCIICGAFDQQHIKAPKAPDGPVVCPPHKWKNVHTIKILKDVTAEHPDCRGFKYIQQCDHCGDMRTIVQTD